MEGTQAVGRHRLSLKGSAKAAGFNYTQAGRKLGNLHTLASRFDGWKSF